MAKMIFLGTPAPAAVALRVIAAHPEIEIVGIVTQPDRPGQRGKVLQAPPVKQVAQALGLTPILQPESTRDPSFLEQLVALAPQLGVIAAYGEILRKAVLESMPAGYLNIHPSLLPMYRGPTPVPAAILNGDAETGVTVMQLSRKMDAGPILAQQSLVLGPDARSGPLLDQLFEMGAQLLLAHLDAYLAGRLMPQPQDESQASYTTLLSREHGRIDWSHTAAFIERMIRAYDPWPGTFTLWREQSLRILLARPHPAEAANTATLAPGALFQRSNQVFVATGHGLLELLSIQPSGKRPMPAIDWWRGIHATNTEGLY